jgi:putative membrane protein
MHDVDPRILQANERTVLAWIRTALATIALGFMIARLGLWLHAIQPGMMHERWPTWLGASFILLGMLSSIGAVVRFARARRALLEGRPIPSSGGLVSLVAFGLTVLAGVTLVYVLLA